MKPLENGPSEVICFKAGESLIRDMDTAKMFHGCSSTSEMIRWALEYYISAWSEENPEEWEAARKKAEDFRAA